MYSTKSNITTPTTAQDRRAARAISSSADIFSFPRSPPPLEGSELGCGAASPVGSEAAEEKQCSSASGLIALTVSNVKCVGIIKQIVTIFNSKQVNTGDGITLGKSVIVLYAGFLCYTFNPHIDLFVYAFI